MQVLRRDNGESKNIQLIDKKCIHNNSLQVINQYAISTEEGAAHDNRYDVTVLVNGLPLIHIELKRGAFPVGKRLTKSIAINGTASGHPADCMNSCRSS